MNRLTLILKFEKIGIVSTKSLRNWDYSAILRMKKWDLGLDFFCLLRDPGKLSYFWIYWDLSWGQILWKVELSIFSWVFKWFCQIFWDFLKKGFPLFFASKLFRIVAIIENSFFQLFCSCKSSTFGGNCTESYHFHLQKNLNPLIHHSFKVCYDVEVDELIREFDPDRTEPLESHTRRFRAPKVDFKNKLIPNASEKIEVKCEGDSIKVVAAERIKPGN